MLLVLHNLPSGTRYGDVKHIIYTHCGSINVILDNLMTEGMAKKVTIGVADEADALVILRKLNGVLMAGSKLRVEKMGHNSETSYDSNKNTSRWSQPLLQNNPPSLLSQNTFDLSQHTSMATHAMGPNNLMGQNTMRQNNPMMAQNSMMTRHDNAMGLNPTMMGSRQQITPLLQNPGMVPPPLMGFSAPEPSSRPFYMSQQTNDYENYNSGQRSSQYPDREKPAPSKNYGFPDTGSRRNPNKPIPVWASESDDFGTDYSRNETRDRDRYDSREPSRREKWDSPPGHYGSVERRPTKRPQPWAENSPQYSRHSPEYDSHERSYDHSRGRQSSRHEPRRPNDAGPSVYQRRPYEGPSQSGPSYRRDSPPAYRKGPPRYNTRSQDVRSPPPKRFRADYREPVFKPQPPPYKPEPPPYMKKVVKNLTLEKMIDRETVWRNQAAAEIVKDMFVRIKTNPIIPHALGFNMMKIAVRNRLLVVLNTKIEVKVPDQITLYRRRFRADEDQCFYNRVVRHILHSSPRATRDPAKKEDGGTATVSAKVKKPAKNILKLSPGQVDQALDKLPKYPQGDKKAHQIHKQQFKSELKQQTEPELDPATKKAIDEELDVIKDIIIAEAVDPSHEGEKMFCERIVEPAVMGEIKKMIALNVAKRVLNLGTVPLVRILGVPKPPRKAPLDEFLKTRGVTSLKKSDRKPMYIATCKNYDSFDKLCALKDVVIDDVKVLFKPMYLTAPPEKVNHKKLKQQKEREARLQREQVSETNTAVKDIKQENVTPVKKPNETAKTQNNTDIKKEVETPVKSQPAETATEVKKEAATPDKDTTEVEPVAENEELSDNNAVQAELDLGGANDGEDGDDYEDYGAEDNSELNEDDLEDY